MFNKHYPFHLYLDKQVYFLTARTVDKIKFFNSEEKLEILYSCIKEAADKYDVKIYAYVILSNHYHLLVFLPQGKRITDFIRFVHGKSGKIIKRKIKLSELDGSKPEALTIQNGRRVWWDYWDKCIHNEKDFWRHFNYIHQNPVKHDYAEFMVDYQFSSYNHYLNNRGQDWLDSVFTNYPIIDFK